MYVCLIKCHSNLVTQTGTEKWGHKTHLHFVVQSPVFEKMFDLDFFKKINVGPRKKKYE